MLFQKDGMFDQQSDEGNTMFGLQGQLNGSRCGDMMGQTICFTSKDS